MITTSRRLISLIQTHTLKDCSINDEIERLRHSATSSLFERRDIIVVSSVSCIYGLGDPDDYFQLVVSLRPGEKFGMDELLRRLVDIRYSRNDIPSESGATALTFILHIPGIRQCVLNISGMRLTA